jgi:type IV secretory pathway VirB10-like protein
MTVMAEECSVQVTREPGVRNQFGRGNFYQTDRIASRKVMVISALALVSAAAGVVMIGSPDPEITQRQASGFLPLQSPQSQASAAAIDVPRVEKNLAASGASGDGNSTSNARRGHRLSGPQLVIRPRNITIPPGALAEGILISGASNGPVKAKLTQALMQNGETLIEEGAILFGQGQSTEERLYIRFSKVIFPDGTIAAISAQAADPDDKIAGVKGSKIGPYALRLGAAIGLNFVSGLSEGMQDQDVQQGVAVKRASVKNSLLNGASRAAIAQSQESMNELHNQKPIIEVGAGTKIFVLFEDNRPE